METETETEKEMEIVVLWERRGRRGEAPMCCTVAVTDCTVHRVRLTLVTRTHHLD